MSKCKHGVMQDGILCEKCMQERQYAIFKQPATKLDIERLEKRIAALEPVKKTKKEDVLNTYYLGKLKEIITLARKLSVISQDELFKELVVTLDQEAAELQYVLKAVTMGEDEEAPREEAGSDIQ